MASYAPIIAHGKYNKDRFLLERELVSYMEGYGIIQYHPKEIKRKTKF